MKKRMKKRGKRGIILTALFFILLSIFLFSYFVLGVINTETVESTNDVGWHSSIALDSNGKVHISHYDNTNADLRYCNNTAGTWSCTAVDTADDVGRFSSIAIDSNNKVHISYLNQTDDDLKYCNNTAGSWSCTTIDTVGAVGWHNSIAIDSNNKVHISHADSSFPGGLKYCNNTAGTWSCADIDTNLLTGYFTSIAIDSNNKVHISEGDGGNGDLKYCNNTAGTWSCTTIDGATDSVGDYSSIAIDSNNKVHISYQDVTGKDLKYCNNTAGSWSCITIDSTGEVGQYSSIAIDSNNKVHISYYDNTNDELKYCNNAEGFWSCAKLADANVSPNGRALAIKKGRLVDSTSFSNYIHISWRNNTDLMYTNVSLDITAPRISVIYPFNNLNTSNTGLDINYTVLDVNLSSCWYSNDTYSVNTTLANCANITTITWSEGQHNVTIWANDTTNNVNSSSITFVIDTVAPTITFTCSPSSVTVGGTVTCSCSGSDVTSGVNATSYTANPLTSSTGTFTTTCTITDYAGNSANATTTYTVLSVGTPPETKPTQSQTFTFTQVTPSQPAEMIIDEPEIDLTKITISTTETVKEASLKITKVDVSEVLSEAEIGVGIPTGEVYQAFDINTIGINDTNIANATIEFKVNKTWLEEQNLTTEDVKLYRKTENVWNPWQALNTSLINEDSQYYYFSAISPGFSTFVIFIDLSQCEPGEKRCFNDEIQVCLENYTWLIEEKCKIGCKDNECIPVPFGYEKGLLSFYIIAGLIIGGVAYLVYYIYKRARKKR